MPDMMLLGDGAANPYHITEHYLRRVLVGDLESVRARIIGAMERLEYDILDDEANIVRGRRGARGWATAHSSADVLDYPMTLIVRLKANGPRATRVTFDYIVKHPALSFGEKEILTREAEAISSLAMVRPAEKMCSTCGTESTDDSRFCRRCGTQMTFENSELEVLRMSAEVRAGHTSVVSTAVATTAVSLLLGAVILTLVVQGVVLTKGVWALLIASLVVTAFSTLFAGFGWNRMNRALKSKPREAPAFKEFVSPPAAYVEPPDAGDRALIGSVTEGTTNLLDLNGDPGKTGEFSADETSVIASR